MPYQSFPDQMANQPLPEGLIDLILSTLSRPIRYHLLFNLLHLQVIAPTHITCNASSDINITAPIHITSNTSLDITISTHATNRNNIFHGHNQLQETITHLNQKSSPHTHPPFHERSSPHTRSHPPRLNPPQPAKPVRPLPFFTNLPQSVLDLKWLIFTNITILHPEDEMESVLYRDLVRFNFVPNLVHLTLNLPSTIIPPPDIHPLARMTHTTFDVHLTNVWRDDDGRVWSALVDMKDYIEREEGSKGKKKLGPKDDFIPGEKESSPKDGYIQRDMRLTTHQDTILDTVMTTASTQQHDNITLQLLQVEKDSIMNNNSSHTTKSHITTPLIPQSRPPDLLTPGKPTFREQWAYRDYFAQGWGDAIGLLGRLETLSITGPVRANSNSNVVSFPINLYAYIIGPVFGPSSPLRCIGSPYNKQDCYNRKSTHGFKDKLNSGGDVRSSKLSPVSRFQNLTHLTLKYCDIADFIHNYHHNLPSLNSLSVDKSVCDRSIDDLYSFLDWIDRTMPKLTKLTPLHWHISPLILSMFSFYSRLTTLVFPPECDVSCQVDHLKKNYNGNGASGQLSYLILDDDDNEVIPGHLKNDNCTSLTLNYSNKSAISELKRFTSMLPSLDGTQNAQQFSNVVELKQCGPASDIDVEEIAQSSCFSKLQRLVLFSSHLTHEAILSVLNSPYMSNLMELSYLPSSKWDLIALLRGYTETSCVTKLKKIYLGWRDLHLGQRCEEYRQGMISSFLDTHITETMTEIDCGEDGIVHGEMVTNNNKGTSIQQGKTSHHSNLDSPEYDIFKDFITSPNLSNIEEIKFDNIGLNATLLINIAQSPIISQLKSLSIEESRSIRDQPFQLGAGRDSNSNNRSKVSWGELFFTTPSFQNLQYLHLKGVILTDNDVYHLSQSPCLYNLTQLDLINCGISNVGVGYLTNSKRLPKLTKLDLSSNTQVDFKKMYEISVNKTSNSARHPLQQRFGELSEAEQNNIQQQQQQCLGLDIKCQSQCICQQDGQLHALLPQRGNSDDNIIGGDDDYQSLLAGLGNDYNIENNNTNNHSDAIQSYRIGLDDSINYHFLSRLDRLTIPDGVDEGIKMDLLRIGVVFKKIDN